MKEILISILTILIVSIGFNIYHFKSVDSLSTQLSKLKVERAVELDEFNKAIDNNKLLMVELEKQKSKIVTKYIPISTASLNSCEEKLKAIEDTQKLFFEVQR